MQKALVVFDIDGVLRDVGGSYRRATADTVEHFTQGAYRPALADIDQLKAEGLWNNDWDASQELIYRYFERQGRPRAEIDLKYETLVAFFQSRYRGLDPDHWTGYICSETLLLEPAYLKRLTDAGVSWGFFSGAMRDEALYILEGKLGLERPVLVAMEDAPGKPDPTGLFTVIEQLEKLENLRSMLPVIYVGDTVADMYTIERAKQLRPGRSWLGVGVLPPHVQDSEARCSAYTESLKKAGAIAVFRNVEALTPSQIQQLLN